VPRLPDSIRAAPLRDVGLCFGVTSFGAAAIVVHGKQQNIDHTLCLKPCADKHDFVGRMQRDRYKQL
jgi:hypothetical protein